VAYRAFGTESSGIGAVTYPLPSNPTSWVAGDLLLLVVETGDEVPAAPSGWTLMIDGVIAGQTRLSIFWKIAVTGETAPTVADPGDHQLGHTVAISGVDATRPWDLVAGGGPALVVSTITTASASISCPSVTTTTAGCQIVNVVSVPLDSATWPFSTTWTNAALTGIGGGAGLIGHAAADGNGGAFGGIVGTKATAGATGSTTSTLSSAQQQVLITIALRPPDTSITGTASLTLAGDTATAAGSAAAAGTGSVSLAGDALAGAGTIDGAPVSGTASITLAGDTASASAAAAVTGTAAATLAGDVLVAAGAGPSVLGIHSVTSAIALFGVTGGTTLTAPGGKPLTGGGTIDPDGRTLVNWDPPASGATFYAVVARPKSATKSISDNKGNTWSQIGTAQDYQPASSWETAVYQVFNAAGGSNTIVTIPNLVTEEATLIVVALEQANLLKAHVTGYSATAVTITSPSITTSGPALLLFTLFGDGPVLGGTGTEGTPLTITVTSPAGTVVVESRIINHNGGWIQAWMCRLLVAGAGTYSITVTQGRAEGGRWYVAAYQTTDFASGDATITLAGDIVSAAGAAAVSGALASTLGGDIVAAAGSTSVAGDASLLLGGDASVGSGAASVVGAAANQMAPDTVAAAGDAAGSISGSATITLAGDAASAAGAADVAAVGAVVLGADVVSSSASASVAGASTIQLAGDLGDGSGFALDPGTISGSLSSTLAPDAIDAAGIVVAGSQRPGRVNYSTTATQGAVVPTSLVVGDLDPDLVLHLQEPNNTNTALQTIDITGAQAVAMRWRRPDGTVVTRALEVVDAAGGLVRYRWQAGDTSQSGQHRIHVVITWANGDPQTVPSDTTFYAVAINPQLA
jgi:hypothetical protein